MRINMRIQDDYVANAQTKRKLFRSLVDEGFLDSQQSKDLKEFSDLLQKVLKASNKTKGYRPDLFNINSLYPKLREERLETDDCYKTFLAEESNYSEDNNILKADAAINFIIEVADEALILFMLSKVLKEYIEEELGTL